MRIPVSVVFLKLHRKALLIEKILGMKIVQETIRHNFYLKYFFVFLTVREPQFWKQKPF